ncbi:hypothetical protein EDC94DRAFT_616499 [Helicostylum pulchrum]|nr:hypothetical protein EDC94DRAFT_616499 [Helicostylum pulchrum]
MFLPLRYSRIDHPVECWIVKSILDYIEMFFETSSVRSFGSESTLFYEMWFLKIMIINGRNIIYCL